MQDTEKEVRKEVDEAIAQAKVISAPLSYCFEIIKQEYYELWFVSQFIYICFFAGECLA